jgi:inorganic phosphate transporter, PiT family
MIELALLAAALMLAYGNGANDNFKGVATLYGSGVLSYSQARWLSTAATLAGALAAVFLAEALLKAFSGRGLVPTHVVADPAFAVSVALAAGLTVALATRIGMPISTTHALVGGLVGAGSVAAGSALNLGALTQQFVAPLVLGPPVAFAIAAILALLQRRFWPVPKKPIHANTIDESCLCVGAPSHAPELVHVRASAPATVAALRVQSATLPAFAIGTTNNDCAQYVATATSLVVTESRAVNAAHIVSAVSVCFARGLNDAPKIAALLLVTKSLGVSVSIAGIALAMAIGGWFHSRRIAETMSHKIAQLEPRSSFLGNLCTSALVIAASKYGLPLSTTHVSVGAISGLSIGGEKISRATLKQILLSWIATLPCAAALGALAYTGLNHLLR